MTSNTADLPRPLVAATRSDTSTRRFATALAVALAVHLALILGVSFLHPKGGSGGQVTRPLEITVLRQPAPAEKPQEPAEVLAQIDREGGGIEKPPDTEVKPVVESVEEVMEPDSAPLSVEALPPAISQSASESTPAVEPEPPPSQEAQELTTPIESLSPEQPPQPPVLTESQPEQTPKPEPAPASEPPKPEVTAAQILASRNLEIAELNARIQRSSVAYAKRPRRKAISASTREYKYASYLEAWRRKVERVGNLNYPEEAKRRKMYGNLILHVSIRADGSVERIQVLRSSGFDLLDEAAIKIVQLSAPFAPFPPDIKSETDVLDITRTWQFLSSNRLGWEN